MAGILQQKDVIERLRVIAYARRFLKDNELKWHVREHEALAIVWCVNHFGQYIMTAPHTIVNTDHQSLKCLTTNKRITIWALQEYNITIRYREANQQIHVDMLTHNIGHDKDEDSDDEWQRMVINAERMAVNVVEVKDLDKVTRYVPTIEEFKTLHRLPSVREHQADLNLKNIDGLLVTTQGKIYIPKSSRMSLLVCARRNPSA